MIVFSSAGAIVAVVFLLRIPVIGLLSGGRGLRPLIWAAPRGLITVLLFYSLPLGTVPEIFPPGALILVVLMSCVIMALGFRLDGDRHARARVEDDAIERRVEAGAAPPP